ncbi:alpha/beta hydrolase [Agromyces sp. G08B096]|uniref:Alpha/beta hydrolase n=1 Tax=Agromyces sp. G08B096 TaxID=3156399 RepID=A0AAU7W8G5_9MICO
MTTSTGRRAVIVHGYGATPDDHWFGWLADRLTRAGTPTTVPALPDPGSPSRERWAAATAEALGVPGPDLTVIAHSLGCLAALRHLASLREPWRLGALVLVSGFVDPLPALPSLDGFIGDGVDVSAIRDRVESITVLRSDDDLIVPAEHTDRLAGLLGTSAQVVPGAGHFLASDGVTMLPEALAAVA